MTTETECTTPSHSQSLANLVANIHPQGLSAARTKICNFIRKTIRIRVANSFTAPNSQVFCLEFGAENSERVRIRIRIRSRIAATAVHSEQKSFPKVFLSLCGMADPIQYIDEEVGVQV